VRRWLLILFLVAASLRAQITVKSGEQARIPANGATSAVSLDQHVADAIVEDGVLTVTGIDPGDTRVVAFRAPYVVEYPVHVLPGPLHYPPGFVSPEEPGQATGSYETLFSSDRLLFENTLDLEHRGLLQTTQLHLVTASFASQQQPDTFVPSAYYRIATRHSDVTLLDKTVNESPLTLQNVVVRGLHAEEGDWHFHGGYTSSAEFADVLIPTEKELAVGLSARTWLSKFMTVTPAVYFIRSIDLVSGRPHCGGIASLLWDGKFPDHWTLRGEVAYGRGLAYAGELHHNTETTQLNATIMDRKLSFPSLRTSSLPGLNGYASFTHLFGPRWSVVSGASVNDIVLQTIQQDSHTAFTNMRFKFGSWSATSGFNYGSFTTIGFPGVGLLTLPQQINFDRARFGAGFQYQFSAASDSLSNGNGIGQTARLKLRRFELGEFFERQKDALSVNSLSSQLPAIQQALQKLGIVSVNPEQLTGILQDAAFLHRLGFANQAEVLTVPSRLQDGGSISWASAGPRPHQFSFSYLSSIDRFQGTETRLSAFTGSYSKAMGSHNYLQANWSSVNSDTSGAKAESELVSVSFRHTFSRASEMFMREKSTNISGMVFIDRSRHSVNASGNPPVPGATVVLDGRRKVMTDAAGHFHFSGVSEGDHQVQLQYQSEREHYFTTPTDAVVAGGASIDFGIAFSETDLWGYVEDDTGNGLENVKLVVKGDAGDLSLSTDKSGKFDMPDVRPGTYSIAVDPESVDLGYSTEELGPIDVRAAANTTPHPVFRIPAMRTFTGQVTMYDPAAGEYVAVKGARLRINLLGRDTTTDARGRFVLSGLPAGDLDVTLTTLQSLLRLTIHLPARPVTLKRDFRISSLNGEIASTAGSESQ
jgi:hypothetical protein